MSKIFSAAFIMALLVSCNDNDGWSENPIENLCSNRNIGDVVKCLKSLPKEDILGIPAVREYLSLHKVYLSFSTSPKRIEKAIWALKSLDLEHIEKIFLTLPSKYRNEEEYGAIPEEILNFPKTEIIGRDQKDIGPATKILYALKKVGESDPDAIVISIDDDTGLPNGGVGQLIKYAVLHPNAVVGASGRYHKIFGVNTNEWPDDLMTKIAPFCGRGELSYCNILEGYKGVAYRPRLLNIEKVTQIISHSKACLTSDDFAISYVLALDGVERIRISNEYFYQVNQFDFGFGADALNRFPKTYADGWKPRFSWAGVVGVEDTASRYQRCAYDLEKSGLFK